MSYPDVYQTHLLAVARIFQAGLDLGLPEPVARAWSEGCYVSAKALAKEFGREDLCPSYPTEKLRKLSR